jgi:phosphatidylinositol alpha-mannosyltransferase
VRVLAPTSDRHAERSNPHLYRLGRTFSVPANGSVARITLSFHVRNRLRDLLEQERFDVIHLHEPLMPALPVTVLGLASCATVGTFHAFAESNAGYYYGKPLLRRYFRKLSALVAVSPAARDFVSQYFPGDYSIIPNGVDVQRFRPRSRVGNGHVNILFLGRLEKRKGLGYLLRAYLEARERDPRLRLTVVGDGRLRRRYEQFVEKNRLPGIRFLGHVPDAHIAEQYANADIFCAPNVGRESFGIVLLEAMASGLPVIAADIPGFRQVVESGRTGILVPPKDASGLAEAISGLARDADLRQDLGQAARGAALHYAWDSVVDRLLPVYDRACQVAGGTAESALVHSEVPSLG